MLYTNVYVVNINLQSCWVVVVVTPPRMNLCIDFQSLDDCPAAHFFCVPLSHGAPVLQIPRPCLCLDAVSSLHLQILMNKVIRPQRQKMSNKNSSNMSTHVQ